MAVVVVVQGTPKPDSAEVLERYKQATLKVLGRHGGEVVMRGNYAATMCGARRWALTKILRFPSREAAFAWEHDPDYVAAASLRDEGYAELEIVMYDLE